MSCLSLRGCLRDDWHEFSRSLFGLVKSSTKFVGTQNLEVFFRSLKKGIAVQSVVKVSCGNSLRILFIVKTFLELGNRSFETKCLALSSCGATPSCLIKRPRKSTCLTPKWHVDIVNFSDLQRGDIKKFSKKSRTVPKQIKRGDPLASASFVGYVKKVKKNERGDH